MWLYLCGATVGLGYLFLWNRWQYWKRRGVKGPTPSVFGMGNSLELFTGFVDSSVGIKKWNKEYGEIYGIFGMWKRPGLVINDPETIKEITVKQFSRFPTRGRSRLNYIFGKMSKDFITVTEGHTWKRQRTTITPFFSGARLSEMTPILANASNMIIRNEVKTSVTSGESLNTKTLSQVFTMTSIMSTGFNIDAEENEELMKSAVEHGRAFIATNWLKSLLLLLIPDSIRFYFNMVPYPRATDHFFRNLSSSIFTNAAEARAKGEKVRPSFVSLMSEHIIEDSEKEIATKGFTKDEIVAQSLLFIIAGFDTTSSSLQFMLYSMAMYPDVQEEIVRAINAEVKGDVTYDNLKKLKIIDASMKESLRLFNVNPFNARTCDETTEVNGITIEKGSSVVWDIDYIYMSDAFYNDPKKFDPHRFDGQESNTLQDDHWFAFGSGPRGCPAVRWAFIAMKIFLIQLLKEYKIVKTEKTLEPGEWKIGFQGSSAGPDKELLVGFEKR